MASDDAKQPLLTGLLDPSPQTNTKCPSKRRRIRRCKSAPTELVLPDKNGAGLLPRPKSIFGKLHHPSIKQVAMFLAIYLGVGVPCFSFVDNQIKGQKTDGILDVVYFLYCDNDHCGVW